MQLPAAGAEFHRHQSVEGAQENTKHAPMPTALPVACVRDLGLQPSLFLQLRQGSQHQNSHIPSPGVCPAHGMARWQSQIREYRYVRSKIQLICQKRAILLAMN